MSKPLTRRSFLKLSAAAAAVSSLPPAIAQSSSPRKKVLIIGAGLSGLVSGYELLRIGHDVTILEAQRRPGGRVLTLREPFSDGLYADAGAARIPDNHGFTLYYARQFGLTLVPFRPTSGSAIALINGQRLRMAPGAGLDLTHVPLELTPEEKRLGVAGLWDKYIGPALRKAGNPNDPNWPPPEIASFDDITISEYLARQGASPGAIELMDLPYYLPSADSISFLWALREAAYEQKEKTRYKIRGGNDLLPKAFAAKLVGQIHYGSPVVRIAQQASGVEVTAQQGGVPQVFRGDEVICCLPFPVLRKIEIQPAVSEAKQKAIRELTYDSVTRVFLQSRTRYWEKDGCNGFGFSDLPHEVWHPTHDQPGQRGLLVSYMFMNVARRTAAMGEEERLSFVAGELEKVHPGLRDNLEGGISKIWDADPWAGGAYALPSRGQVTTVCRSASQAEGRIHFAGEHTSGLPGWMQGALESGLRAAKEIDGDLPRPAGT